MCAQLHANSFDSARQAPPAARRGCRAFAAAARGRAAARPRRLAVAVAEQARRRGAPRGFEGARDRATARPHGVYQLSSTSRALSERVKALDREVKEMETQLSARARSEGTVDEWEALLDAREALSKRYVGAIKANLELLESIGNDRDAAASV